MYLGVVIVGISIKQQKRDAVAGQATYSFVKRIPPGFTDCCASRSGRTVCNDEGKSLISRPSNSKQNSRLSVDDAEAGGVPKDRLAFGVSYWRCFGKPQLHPSCPSCPGLCSV